MDLICLSNISFGNFVSQQGFVSKRHRFSTKK